MLREIQEVIDCLPDNGAIWGGIDVLNTSDSSKTIFQSVKNQVESFESVHYYIGLRQLITVGENRPNLIVYDFDPRIDIIPLEENATAVNGPLLKNEAIAAGYLLQTASIAQDVLENRVELITLQENKYFNEILQKIPGNPRFLPLGILTLNDFISRMMHYRNVQSSLNNIDIDENELEDMGVILDGPLFVPLADAFRKDNFEIRDNFENVIDSFYAGNPNLFIPFAGFIDQPKTTSDHLLVGLGMTTGVRLFRKILKMSKSSNSLFTTPTLPI